MRFKTISFSFGVLDIEGVNKVGQVKVAGEVWSAICEGDTLIAKDSKITVLAISGVKLVVKEISE